MALSIRGRTVEQHRSPRRVTGLVALLAALSLFFPAVAQAAPSQDDIDRARAEENAAKMSVAQIEVELANVTSQAQQTTQAAQIAAEELNDAKIKLQEATDTATKAKEESAKAQADYDKGRQELASVVQTAYRSDGSSLDALAPYLESDGLRTVEAKQAAIQTFGSAAESKMQRVAALEQVAKIMKDAADKAVANQQEATDEVQTRTDAAQAAAESAVALQNQTEARRQVLTEELAKKENTTVALIQERQTYLEEQRQKAAEEAARKAAAQ
uniref:coiled-coil domain-containing protein n=1 Tax=Actinomyces polynesiensis TaxID=1325934 RepID=UPI0038B23D68